MNPARALLSLLVQAPGRHLALLFFTMLAVSLSEGIGVMLLVPLIDLAQGGNGIASSSALSRFLRPTGLPISMGLLLVGFLILVVFRSMVLYYRDQLSATVQHALADDLRQQCFAALLAAEWRWLAAGRRADHANLLLTDVNQVGVGLHFEIGRAHV